jgi:biopolymer transport protein TolR
MAASIRSPARPGGGRRSRARRHVPMHEINVTPFVDVMLVLLIVFMVTAPLLTVGVPIELPETKGEQLQAAKEPLVISVNGEGKIYIQETEVAFDELVPRLRAIAKQGASQQIFFRGSKGADYQQVTRLMDHIRAGGFHRIGLVTAGDK